MATGASSVLKQKLEKGSGATSSAGKLITNQPLGYENANGERNSCMPKLRPGMAVRLTNLQKASHLNMMQGVLISFDTDTRRWNVDLANCERKAIRVENLKPVPPRKGQEAQDTHIPKNAGRPISTGGHKSRPSTGGVNPLPAEVFCDNVSQNLVPCQVCNRTFAIDRIAKHQMVCQKVLKKRPVFRSERQRTYKEGGSDGARIGQGLPMERLLSHARGTRLVKRRAWQDKSRQLREAARMNRSHPMPLRGSQDTKRLPQTGHGGPVGRSQVAKQVVRVTTRPRYNMPRSSSGDRLSGGRSALGMSKAARAHAECWSKMERSNKGEPGILAKGALAPCPAPDGSWGYAGSSDGFGRASLATSGARNIAHSNFSSPHNPLSSASAAQYHPHMRLGR